MKKHQHRRETIEYKRDQFQERTPRQNFSARASGLNGMSKNIKKEMSLQRDTTSNRVSLEKVSRLKQPTPVRTAEAMRPEEKSKPRTNNLAPRQGESGTVSDEESDEHDVDTPGREGAGTHLSERINMNQTSSKKKIRTGNQKQTDQKTFGGWLMSKFWSSKDQQPPSLATNTQP